MFSAMKLNDPKLKLLSHKTLPSIHSFNSHTVINTQKHSPTLPDVSILHISTTFVKSNLPDLLQTSFHSRDKV